MKFDCIVSNAPYDNGLHEKFESKYFELCKGEIVWVSPLSFLLGKKQNKRITLELDKYKTDIEQINGNEYFDAAIGGTMGIVFCDMADEHNEHYVKFDGKQYNKCEEIRSYSNDELLMEFKSIVEPLYTKDNIDMYIKSSENAKNVPYKLYKHKGYCAKMDLFAGSGSTGAGGESFYTLFSNNKSFNSFIDTYSNFLKLGDKFKIYVSISSEYEGTNFYNYCKTYFARLCLYLSKTTLHLDRGELKTVPWFDFSDSIFNGSPEEIDIALFNKYNISQDIINHIIKILPNYYGLDLEKYKG